MKKEKVKERLDKNAPPVIINLIKSTYYWILKKRLRGTFLDVGCGEMNFGNELFGAVGTDIAKNLKTCYTRADATQLPFLDKSFDYIICFETIEHILEQKKVIKEFERIARKKIIIGSINKDGPEFIEEIKIWKGKMNPFHIKELGIKDFKRLFKRFKNKKFYRTSYDGKKFFMMEGLTKFGYSNYVVINL